MTQGKSLVEDMARAMAGSQSSVLLRGDDEQKQAAWREFAKLGLAVLKDRLPADDRELAEYLRSMIPFLKAYKWNVEKVEAAADRIIAYSAGK